MTSRKDNLFSSDTAPVSFVFDEKVADVFDDMINRSVPGYSTIISMIGLLARQYCVPGSRVYDLGCSLGAATLAIHNQVPHQDYQLIAIDNSPAMMDRCRNNLDVLRNQAPVVDLRCADILETELQQASVVVLNFTLQFIAPEQRAGLIARIWSGMLPGGILILSEKIRFPDQTLDHLFIDAYHSFKQRMGYSEMEISKKRAALENVLVPESIATHKKRTLAAGFSTVDVWFQCFNFASLVAIR
ncbi:MAG: carboxy-S-adenosyl-L-methionine synthase CmoA [Pseudomonadales bacterium]|nr:carboxy-S-adenosyl-L-methionine synthase CmoA [Pseudomonadales bacterium]